MDYSDYYSDYFFVDDHSSSSIGLRPYKHRPLDKSKTEFRLLRIEISNKTSSGVVLALEHAYLANDPNFYALSYCWGNEPILYEVAVHDGSSWGYIHVRQNLHDFLQAARSWQHEWLQEWIWIDQICIDQSDPQERGHQVGLMGDLYSQAKATLIWPGALRYYPELEPSVHKDTAQDVLSFGGTRDIMQDIVRSPREKSIYKQAPDSTRNFSNREVEMLVSSQYWTRTWIVQEVLLSSQAFVLVRNEIWNLRDLHVIVYEFSKALESRRVSRDLIDSAAQLMKICDIWS
ncbi:hypothetical protein E8E13_000719 [Curvularia kusanoi]|uniref:Heterokaryon incompatibility domain-containing protein n=1 Tax=Curvularia kusanoi TaxID=90978 RepID=A0A9P4T4L7_CURKU|nr:hypothetical protein E8E13_000719 [Curvularia kusanoi]